jgi:hypothetical protein
MASKGLGWAGGKHFEFEEEHVNASYTSLA